MVALDRAEVGLAQDLQRTGFSRSSSVLAIIMATRGYVRPEADLVEIVRQYPGLESVVEARLAIQELLQRAWLTQTEAYGLMLTHQSSGLRELISAQLNDSAVAEKLASLRVDLEPYVNVVGPMREVQVFHSYLHLLGSAQREICMPMLATAPYGETVRVLRARAEAGVRVRILVAEPALVASLRKSETMRVISAERIAEWRKEFRDRPTVEIRMCRTPSDMELATCFSVDGEILRFDIYDPHVQQSLEGIMIEVVSPQGVGPNLVRLFLRLFDEAWGRSVGVGILARPFRFARRWWKLWLAVVTLALAFFPISVPHWSEILIGVSCGIGAPLIIEEGPRVGRLARRRWSR